MTRIILALTITLSLGAFHETTAQAHDGHNHETSTKEGKHGGEVRDFPPYTGELLIRKDKAELYLYDKDMVPFANYPEEKLKAQITYPAKGAKAAKPIEFEFKREMGGKFTATLPRDPKTKKTASDVHRYDLHVFVKDGDKEIQGDFGIDNVM